MKRNNNLIYDVGMHKGEDTSYYLKKGFNVVAFEADPELVSLCKEKFAAEIKEGRLVIIEGAIVESTKIKEKVVRFYKNNENSVWGTVVNEWSHRNELLGTSNTLIEVPIVDFRLCLETLGVPYYLKIDIEGMDMVCLEALMGCDIKPDYISIESEKINFNKLKKEFELFEKLGYNKYNIVNQADAVLFKEPVDSRENLFLDYKFEFGSSGPFGLDILTPWINKRSALRKYFWIFIGYKFFGDNAKFRHRLPMSVLKVLLQKILGCSIPGWYDTHARHSSINDPKSDLVK